MCFSRMKIQIRKSKNQYGNEPISLLRASPYLTSLPRIHRIQSFGHRSLPRIICLPQTALDPLLFTTNHSKAKLNHRSRGCAGMLIWTVRAKRKTGKLAAHSLIKLKKLITNPHIRVETPPQAATRCARKKKKRTINNKLQVPST